MTSRLPITDPNYMPLIRDTKVLNLSSQSSSGVLLNGDKKSKVFFELKNYMDFENDPSVEYVSVAVPYVVLVNSCYIINDTNNRLDVQLTDINNPNDIIYQSYTFPVGNYNASTLAAASNTVSGTNLQIRVDALTQKHTVQFNYHHGVILASSTIDYILGFSGNVDCPYLVETKLPRCFNYLPVPRFNILGDFLNNGVLLTNSSRDFGNGTVLASVPNNSKNNNMIVYESDANEFILKNPSLNNLTITITDDRNNEIDFNGISWYMSLRISVFRRRIPKLRDFLEIVDYASSLNNIPTEGELLEYAT